MDEIPPEEWISPTSHPLLVALACWQRRRRVGFFGKVLQLNQVDDGMMGPSIGRWNKLDSSNTFGLTKNRPKTENPQKAMNHFHHLPNKTWIFREQKTVYIVIVTVVFFFGIPRFWGEPESPLQGTSESMSHQTGPMDSKVRDGRCAWCSQGGSCF